MVSGKRSFSALGIVKGELRSSVEEAPALSRGIWKGKKEGKESNEGEGGQMMRE